MADELRRQALGIMNEDPVITPNFDRFAAEGIAMTSAVSSVPICTPFRGMLMTGRFPLSTGLVNNAQAGSSIELRESEVCFGDVLKGNGYQTGYIGKWHLEMPSRNRTEHPIDDPSNPWWDGWTPPGPRRHGFDFWYAYNCDSEHFNPAYWKDSPQKIQVNDWSVKHETDVAIEFLKKHDPNRPFALFLSWNPPHMPYVAPEKYKKLYGGRELPPRPNVQASAKYEQSHLSYFAAVSSCDDSFRRLLVALDELGLAEDTIVVFTADHGEMMGSHGRFGKTVWYEESIGIPFLIRWPGQLKPREERMIFAAYDFMPTLLGLMELPIPDSVEGPCYSRTLLGRSSERPSSAFLASYAGGHGEIRAAGQPSISKWVLAARELRNKGVDWRTLGYRGVRTERYTYVVDRSDDETGFRMLYDNREDPYQLNPITALQPDEVPAMARLEKELRQWLVKLNDPFPLA
jgi:arylsulfatase A-like enzyme